jgi:type I restriction enzyme S subunit
MKWQEIIFFDLYAEPSRNGVYKSQEHHGQGVKIVNMGEIFAYGIISNQEMKRLEMNDSEIEKSGLIDGDLLFARRSLVESGAGKCSLVENLSEPTTFESSIIRVRLNYQLSRPKFYYYWFKSNKGRGSIQALVTGTNVKGIKGSDLKNIKVDYPPLNEQEKIVEILSKYDDLIQNNRRRIELLEESARLLYREWFVYLRFPGHEHTPIIDGIPEDWEKIKLEDLANITMGQSPPSEYYNYQGVGLPFHQGVSNFRERFPENQTFCTKESRIAEIGDILFSVRAPVGRINISLDKIIIGRGLAAIQSKFNHQNFLFYQLKNYFFKEDMIGGGVIFAAVTKKDLYNVQLLTPSNSLIQLFIDQVQPIDKQIRILYLQNLKLIEARDILLPRLMNGEIAV